VIRGPGPVVDVRFVVVSIPRFLLYPEPDIEWSGPDVDQVPLADIGLFDHFVGAREQRWRNCEAECLGRLQVDDQLELRRLLDG
jgi:hypothetical protein